MKLLKYILFLLFSLLFSISVSAKEIVIVENQNVFFNHYDCATRTISEEYTWLGLLYLQENSKLVTPNDKTGLSCKQFFLSVSTHSIDAWEMLLRNGRTGLKTDIDALTSLNTLLSNSKLTSKLSGKTTIEIENLLANMKGWSGASYKQVCDKVNLLVDELPANVTGLDKYLGSAGFGNGNVYTNRHSWVQLERMLEPTNKSFIKSASSIVFENPISSTFGNSVSDIAIFKNGRRIEIETKAGLQFFEGVSGSNFPTQSANSLLNVTDIGDYKVFLNPEKIATLNNADKLSIVNTWKGNSGDFLGDAQIRQLFTDYWDDIPSIDTGLELENLLKNRSDWFDDIFKNNIE